MKKIILGLAMMLVMVMLFGAAGPLGEVRAQEGGGEDQPGEQETLKGVPPSPTPVSPSGTINDRTPTYKWTVISGATKYQIQVYRGTTKVYDKAMTSNYCSGSYCQWTTPTDLPDGYYKWHVRAYKGTWSYYSSYKTFSVKVGFDSQFNSGADGWSTVYGTWVPYNYFYIHTYSTEGVVGYDARIAYPILYGDLDYQVNMMRKEDYWSNQANYIFVRGTFTPSSDKGYKFAYDNYGFYLITRQDGGGFYTTIKSGSSSSINKNGWNTLRVLVKGSVFRYYINGTQVHLFWESTYPSGKVGIGMHRSSTSTSNRLLVNSAKLTTTVP